MANTGNSVKQYCSETCNQEVQLKKLLDPTDGGQRLRRPEEGG